MCVCVCACACVRCPEPHLKAVLPRGDVHGSEVDHVAELGVGVVPEEGQHGNHAVRVDHHLQLVVARHLEEGHTRTRRQTHRHAHTNTHFSVSRISPSIMTFVDDTFVQYVLLYMLIHVI